MLHSLIKLDLQHLCFLGITVCAFHYLHIDVSTTLLTGLNTVFG